MAEPKYKLAVGLHYEDKGSLAPTIGIKGELARADDVVKIANRYNIPVVENPEVTRAAHELPIDQQIPKELFQAVAVILNAIENGRTA